MTVEHARRQRACQLADAAGQGPAGSPAGRGGQLAGGDPVVARVTGYRGGVDLDVRTADRGDQLGDVGQLPVVGLPWNLV